MMLSALHSSSMRSEFDAWLAELIDLRDITYGKHHSCASLDLNSQYGNQVTLQ